MMGEGDREHKAMVPALKFAREQIQLQKSEMACDAPLW
jgi:hypothetical protein